MPEKKPEIAELVKQFTFDPLPNGFTLAKPKKQNTYKEETIYGLENAGQLLITRKRDGWKLFAVKFNDQWKLYTDGMNEVTNRLPHIVDDLAKMDVGNGSILVGEGIVQVAGKDQAAKMGSILNINSSTAKALEAQKTLGNVSLILFDVLFGKGLMVIDQPYSDRFDCLIGLLSPFERGLELRYVNVVEPVGPGFDKAKELVRKNGWEGLVLYDLDAGSSFRLDGKDPERVDGCWKWKPIYEDDFIATGWLTNDKGGVKDLTLAQIDPKTGKQFDCGKFGHFTNKDRERLKTAKYPLVIQLEFELRFPTGKLRNSTFMRFREDKKPKDCVATKSYPEAKFL